MSFSAILDQFGMAFALIYERAIDILKQPALNKEMLWILLPSIVALFLMELYFGRYTKEKLGWNSAVSNSLVLFFVGMNLASWLYAHEMLAGVTQIDISLVNVAIIKTFIAIFILVESALLLVLNFFHLVIKKFAFGISSTLIMNFVGVISILLVYSDIVIDIMIFPAVLLIFTATVVFFWFIHLIEPKVNVPEPPENIEPK